MNELIRTILGAWEDVELGTENISLISSKLNATYRPEVAEKKLQEIKDSNKKLRDGATNRIQRAYEKAYSSVSKEIESNFSGSAITDDIKLLDTRYITLTSPEINILIERYKSNQTMLRIINKYVSDNKINNIKVVDIEPINSKLEKVNQIYNYGISYIGHPKGSQEEIKTKFFDNVGA